MIETVEELRQKMAAAAAYPELEWHAGFETGSGCTEVTATFPRIAPWIGQPVPEGSIACDNNQQPGEISESEECELEVWLDPGPATGVAMVLLQAELAED